MNPSTKKLIIPICKGLDFFGIGGNRTKESRAVQMFRLKKYYYHIMDARKKGLWYQIYYNGKNATSETNF